MPRVSCQQFATSEWDLDLDLEVEVRPTGDRPLRHADVEIAEDPGGSAQDSAATASFSGRSARGPDPHLDAASAGRASICRPSSRTRAGPAAGSPSRAQRASTRPPVARRAVGERSHRRDLRAARQPDPRQRRQCAACERSHDHAPARETSHDSSPRRRTASGSLAARRRRGACAGTRGRSVTPTTSGRPTIFRSSSVAREPERGSFPRAARARQRRCARRRAARRRPRSCESRRAASHARRRTTQRARASSAKPTSSERPRRHEPASVDPAPARQLRGARPSRAHAAAGPRRAIAATSPRGPDAPTGRAAAARAARGTRPRARARRRTAPTRAGAPRPSGATASAVAAPPAFSMKFAWRGEICAPPMR